MIPYAMHCSILTPSRASNAYLNNYRRSYTITYTQVHTTFKRKDLIIQHATSRNPAYSPEDIPFGTYFGNHMLNVDWNIRDGWSPPMIVPHQPFIMNPASSIFHYAVGCFEGLKAFKDIKGKIRLFRPLENLRRFNRSAERLVLPTFDADECLECLKELLRVDNDIIPRCEDGNSLYIRPTLISTSATIGVHISRNAKLFIIISPVSSYFKNGVRPISLYADAGYVRSWPGGTGGYKVGSNYAPALLPMLEAVRKGYDDVLWVLDDMANEAGTMNIFVYWINASGERELVTPPIDGTILPGITRDSVLQICRQWNEFKVHEGPISMMEVQKATYQGRILEVFGTGTAANIIPVNCIHYKSQDLIFPLGESNNETIGELSKRIMDALNSIQVGEIDSPWSIVV